MTDIADESKGNGVINDEETAVVVAKAIRTLKRRRRSNILTAIGCWVVTAVYLWLAVSRNEFMWNYIAWGFAVLSGLWIAKAAKL